MSQAGLKFNWNSCPSSKGLKKEIEKKERMWNAFISSYFFKIEHISSAIRLLEVIPDHSIPLGAVMAFTEPEGSSNV